MKQSKGTEKPPKLVKCPKCGYIWEAKVPKPKACPECKVRLGWYTRKRDQRRT